MKNQLKPSALFMLLLFVGLFAFKASYSVEQTGVKGCKYAKSESDYCKWGPAKIYDCVNNDSGTDCNIIIDQEEDEVNP